MKFCYQCGKQLDEKLMHCPFCGAMQEEGASADVGQESERSGMGEVDSILESGLNETRDALKQRRISRKAIMGIIAGIVALFAIAGVAAFFLMSPDLPEDKVLSDFDSVSVDTTTLSDSSWGSNEGYEETSREVQSIEENDREIRKATVARVYENDSFKVTCIFEASYILENDEWLPHELFELSRSIEPVAGISDEMVLNQAPSILSSVEETPHEDINGYDITLEDIYGDSAEYSIIENNTSAEGGSVILQVSAVDGFAKYQGNITAQFVWDGSDWAVSSCTVDDGAYEADLSYFVGTWVGTFEESNLDYFVLNSDSNCLGGNATPLTVTIKSVDQSTMSATADIVFCLHDHGQVTSRQKSDPNDQTITLTDVLIPIEYDNDAYFELVEQDDQPFYEVSLGINEGGLEGHVRSGSRAGSTRTDDFTMVKQ